MRPRHAIAVTLGSAGSGFTAYFCTSEAWVALTAVGIVCLTLLAVISMLSQNRGETKKKPT